MTNTLSLLNTCKMSFEKKTDVYLKLQLKLWVARTLVNANGLFNQLKNSPINCWQELISNHSAATHSWYPYLAEKATIHEFAAFLQEEAEMPAFIPLLKKVQSQLLLRSQIEALEENISDELKPTPHFKLFDRLLNEVLRHTNQRAIKDHLLAETNLVYFHGYFGSNHFALGALYATESMLANRAFLMNQGLTRLGIKEYNRSFMQIHAECDVHHANDWIKKAIQPEIEKNSHAKFEIAEGIAIRMVTSQNYLDRLFEGKTYPCTSQQWRA